MADAKKVKNGFLTVDERAACEQLTGAEAPYGQRATAILALDEGATQAQAAERAGQTKGQVRYWSDKFREKGLAIFPEETVVAETPTVAEEPAAEVAAPVEEKAAVEPEAEPAPEPAATEAKKPSKKKKKKGKGKSSAKKKSGKKKKKGGKKGKKKAAKGGKKKADKKKGRKKGKKKSK